jgi:DNA-binding transcriptional ArsR family regulator
VLAARAVAVRLGVMISLAYRSLYWHDQRQASAAATFALLSNPARLHVLWLAAHDHHDVTALAERAGVGLATMSQHLTKLRLAGFISARRDSRRHIYTVDDPHILTLVQQIFAHIAPDGSPAPDPPVAL